MFYMINKLDITLNDPNARIHPDLYRPKTLRRSTRIANQVGNFFLTPTRYLFNGKTSQCIEFTKTPMIMVVNEEDDTPQPAVRCQKCATAFKVIASALLLLPGLAVGGLIKGTVLAASSNLRNRYVIQLQLLESIKESS